MAYPTPPPEGPPWPRWLPAALVVAVVAAGAFLFYLDRSKGYDHGGSGGGVEVVYEIGGDGTVDITYRTPDGISQEQGRRPPLTVRRTFPRADVYVVSAQTQGDGSFVSCAIVVNGREVSRNQSSGPYAIASCDA